MVKITKFFFKTAKEKMPKREVKFNYLAIMQREVGNIPFSIGSVLNPPKVEKATMPETVKEQRCCILTKQLYSWEIGPIMKKKDEISKLVKTPGLDYRELGSELKKCWKRGTSSHQGTFTYRRTVIDGIKLRAKEICPNDPTYEERQIKELDKILEKNIKELFISIWSDESLE
jgi:hypothetical protein